MERREDWEKCCIVWSCNFCFSCGGGALEIDDYESFERVWDEIDRQNGIAASIPPSLKAMGLLEVFI